MKKNPLRKKRILIVDDEETFRYAMKFCLMGGGYDVATAANADEAFGYLRAQTIDLVLTDINMPRTSGLEVLKAIRRKSQLPVILMTGLTNLSETKEAHGHGADGYLMKPFDKEELFEQIRLCLESSEKKEHSSGEAISEDSERQFSRVPITELKRGHAYEHDFYLRLSSEKFVKIAHRGESLDDFQIQDYRRKGILFLYLRRADFVSSLRKSLFWLSASPLSDLSRKEAAALRRRSFDYLKRISFPAEVDQETFAHARGVIDSTLELLCENESFLRLLERMEKHPGGVLNRGLATALFALQTIHHAQSTDAETDFGIATAAVFCDAGKCGIPEQILLTPRHRLSADETAIYESHPLIAAKILEKIASIPDDILAMITQHHENLDGSGYPQNLKKDRIHRHAQLLSVAGQFVALMPDLSGARLLNADEILNKMVTGLSSALDPYLIAHLISSLRSHPTEKIRAEVAA